MSDTMHDFRQDRYPTVIREMIRDKNDVTNHRIMCLPMRYAMKYTFTLLQVNPAKLIAVLAAVACRFLHGAC
jgi:hypothetical protein